MNCFEVWRNGEKLTTAGLSEAGALIFTLSWVGKGSDASSVAAASSGVIPGIDCSLGGMQGMTHYNWLETNELRLGDELRVRVISADISDPSIRTETTPRGTPGWHRE